MPPACLREPCGADVLTEIGEEKLDGIQKVPYSLGGWQSAMEAVGHQGIRLGTTQGSQELASAHIPASLRGECGPATPSPPAGQLGLSHQSWDLPHLWFLLGSPCGAERPPAGQGLPHLLRVLSCLETTKSHLWGQDGPCRAPRLASCAEQCRAGEAGGDSAACTEATPQSRPRAALPDIFPRSTLIFCWSGPCP